MQLHLPHLLSALLAALASPCIAGVTMTAMTGFGGGDGWRAPGEVLPDDAAGTATDGIYNYLGTGNFERGIAYSAGLDRLILLSRAGGINIRQLDPLTGQDYGAVATGGISGGTFAASMIACGDNATLYAANLATPATTQAFKI